MKDILIKDMNENERPRERVLNDGVSSLSNEELLSIIIKTGTKDISVKTLSYEVLKEFKIIDNLKYATINKLTSIKGIGIVKAIEIISALELGKRVYFSNVKKDIILNNTTKIFKSLSYLFLNETQENFYAVYVDSQYKLINYKLLFKGTLNYSCVHPREVFRNALLENAYAIIVLHNHPSGNITPSTADIELTDALFETGKVIGIPIIDHIIFGKDKYYSFYEKMNKK